MKALLRLKEFVQDYQVLLVGISGIVAIHWSWQRLQYDEKFVRKDERREFPPITLYKIAKHWVGLGPMPEKHSPKPPS